MTTLPHLDRIHLSEAEAVEIAFEGFEFDSVKLGEGALASEYERLAYDDLVVIRNHESHARVDQYRLPPENVALALFHPGNRPVRWCGLEVPVDCALVNPVDGDYMIVLPAGYEGVDLIIGNAVFDALGIAHPAEALGSVPSARWMLPLDSEGHELRSWLFGLFDRGGDVDHIATDPVAAVLFRDDLLARLAELFRRQGAKPISRRVRRYGLVRAAHDLITRRLDEAFGTRELAALLDVSPRVLQYAFRDAFGTTPQQYAVTRRLHAVRRALSCADPGPGGVRREARRFGFTELGRFSRLYESMFGELPSRTLRRR